MAHSSYCLKCKSKTAEVGVHGTLDKKGHPRRASKCSVCGGGKSVPVSMEEARKDGSGMWGKIIGSVLGTAASAATGIPLGGMMGGIAGGFLPI